MEGNSELIHALVNLARYDLSQVRLDIWLDRGKQSSLLSPHTEPDAPYTSHLEIVQRFLYTKLYSCMGDFPEREAEHLHGIGLISIDLNNANPFVLDTFLRVGYSSWELEPARLLDSKPIAQEITYLAKHKIREVHIYFERLTEYHYTQETIWIGPRRFTKDQLLAECQDAQLAAALRTVLARMEKDLTDLLPNRRGRVILQTGSSPMYLLCCQREQVSWAEVRRLQTYLTSDPEWLLLHYVRSNHQPC